MLLSKVRFIIIIYIRSVENLDLIFLITVKCSNYNITERLYYNSVYFIKLILIDKSCLFYF